MYISSKRVTLSHKYSTRGDPKRLTSKQYPANTKYKKLASVRKAWSRMVKGIKKYGTVVYNVTAKDLME